MGSQEDYQLILQQIERNEQYKREIREAALAYRQVFVVRLVERVLGYSDEVVVAFVLAELERESPSL